MKRLYFLLLITSFGFAQNGVEIRLTDISYCGAIPNGTLYQTTESTDPILNSIIQPYGVTLYTGKAGHPYNPYSARIMQINISNSLNINQLILDLQAYSSVVEYAAVADQFTFSDALDLELTDPNIGMSTGTNNGVATTNDTGLNQIFLDNNVFYYSLSYPSLGGNFLKYYNVVCNCNLSQLKSQLDNYSNIVNSTIPTGAVYLSNNQFRKSTVSISPNPFTTNFNIQTDEVISNYSLIDISGKLLINTNSKNELDKLSSQLNSGIYFLNLKIENGQNSTFKLIKE